MFNPFRTEDPALDEAIASALQDLKSFSADEEGYQKTVDQLTKLYALKQTAKPVDPNTLILAAGNLFIALRMLKFEETGVITSKAINFVMSKI